MRRVDGYAPIEAYAALGDGSTVALVAHDGRVDWWAMPRLDDPPLCAALLDPSSGGSFRLAPEEDFEVRRRYLPGTNVLEMTYETDGGLARVIQALNRGGIAPLSWSELACRVVGVVGRVPFVAELEVGDGLVGDAVDVRPSGEVPIVVRGDQHAALVGAGAPTAYGTVVRSRVEVGPGERAVVAVVANRNQPLYLPDAAEIDTRLDATVDAWARWSRPIDPGDRWAPAVARSALTLKMLYQESTGAVAAAATTSLPERLGGDKNWDYRFAWVRDSSYTVEAFFNLGLHDEVQTAVSWLIDAICRSDDQLHVLYSLDGEVVDDQAALDVPGYRHSSPVRRGNQASSQLQLGCYGDLLDTVSAFARRGHVLDRRTVALLTKLADRCADEWDQVDAGIWELPDAQHYTISKMGCWVALDRAAGLAGDGLLPEDRARPWRSAADEVRSWVQEHCWSAARSAYTFYAGTDDLDAAVLLAGRTGFDRGDRLRSTIEAVVDELADGPCVYRYSGMAQEEGAFIACTFWLVQALAWTGQQERAAALLDQGIALANDVGLLAEEIDPGSRAFLGNVPQGLSHLALIDAAHVLRAEARHPGR